MIDLRLEDVEYHHGATRMIGLLVHPAATEAAAPAVVLVHDAFGRGPAMVEHAERLARCGLVVFVADVWGDAREPHDDAEVGALMGAVLGDPTEWSGRVAAAFETARAHPRVDAERVAALGFCFGGSSVLEYARQGGRVTGVAAVHPGLDIIRSGWHDALPGSRVFVAIGSVDPMATPEQWRGLKAELDGSGIDWELALYSGVTHAFTSPAADLAGRPELFRYDARAASAALGSAERFLTDLFAAEPAA